MDIAGSVQGEDISTDSYARLGIPGNETESSVDSVSDEGAAAILNGDVRLSPRTYDNMDVDIQYVVALGDRSERH